DPAIAPHPQRHVVPPVQQLEYGLQAVITVRAPAGDMQEQIELGRSRPMAPVVGCVTHAQSCRPARGGRTESAWIRRDAGTLMASSVAIDPPATAPAARRV